MPELDNAIHAVFQDKELTPNDIPRLDLYMDQILSLFNEGFEKRTPNEKLLTKTMINNYVKEGLITPVKGKKYTREQIMQLLCVYHLKKLLPLSDVKSLTSRDDVDFEQAYTNFLSVKQDLRDKFPRALTDCLPSNLEDPNVRLMVCLALSQLSSYMRHLCEKLIDEQPE